MLLFILSEGCADPNEGRRQDDERLVRAAQRGSRDAFAALHNRHYTRIYRYAFLKTNHVTDAEDIAAETFIRAFKSLHQYRLEPGTVDRPHSLYPWLHRIASNLIVDSHRQRPAHVPISLDAATADGLRLLLADPAATQSPHDIAERTEVQAMVRQAINALPKDQSDVLIHRFLGELTIREIAPLMQRSEAAVKSLLHRAVVAVRDELGTVLNTVRPHSDGNDAKEGLQHAGKRTHGR